MKRTYTYTIYPSHGYAAIPVKDLIKFNAYEDISIYSYINRGGTIAYLEEDNDFPRFIKSLEDKGVTVNFKIKHAENSSRVKNMPDFDEKVKEHLRKISAD